MTGSMSPITCRMTCTAATSDMMSAERFIAAGQFLWIAEMADILRKSLGSRGVTPPTHIQPDWLVRVLAPFVSPAHTGAAGRPQDRDVERQGPPHPGLRPAPGGDTLADCGNDLLDRKLVA